jgi:hypothetical protein
MAKAKIAAAQLALASALCLSLSGCFLDDAIIPPAPTSDTGGDPGSVAFEHDVLIGWKFPEIDALRTLQVTYPGNVTILQAQQSSEFDIQLQLYIEKAHHADYAREYQTQILALSRLDVATAVLNVPAPTHPCVKTVDSLGNITALQGICLQTMTIIVPANHEIPISLQATGDVAISDLALPSLTIAQPDSTHISVTQFAGDLTITGGGPNASLDVWGATSLDLELDAIKLAELQKISGKIHISLNHVDPASPSAVSLDGQAVTSFPFDRP